MSADELFADLCATVDEQSKVLRDTEEKAGAVPWLVTIMSSWLVSMLRKKTCDQKDIIIDAVMKYVDTYVTNAAVRQMILVAIDTASEALCPANPTQ